MPAPKGNKFAEGLTTSGQPPAYDDPKKLTEKIVAYFDAIELNTSKPTVTGLCLFLGFSSRQSFYDYEKREEFSYTIKRARLVIENYYEVCLSSTTPTGPIFALKNMGWEDKMTHDVSDEIKEIIKSKREKAEELAKSIPKDHSDTTGNV